MGAGNTATTRRRPGRCTSGGGKWRTTILSRCSRTMRWRYLSHPYALMPRSRRGSRAPDDIRRDKSATRFKSASEKFSRPFETVASAKGGTGPNEAPQPYPGSYISTEPPPPKPAQRVGYMTRPPAASRFLDISRTCLRGANADARGRVVRRGVACVPLPSVPVLMAGHALAGIGGGSCGGLSSR